ncbi:MAG: TolC family protein [Gemmatimonas sp.]
MIAAVSLVASCALTPVALVAQDSLFALSDFQRRVLASHPELQQVRNSREQARRMILSAQGAFDPKLSASISEKRYGGDPYYRVSDVGISVPTWIGADIKFGYERGVGSKVNPQSYTSPGGLFNLGVSIPLARDIITDERRTVLSQARAMGEAADANFISQSNKLLLTATKAYADWYFAHRKLAIADSGVGLASFRLVSVRARILAGEAPAVDSLEALLEIRRRQVQILEARNDDRIAALEATAFIWQSDTAAIRALSVPTVPDSATIGLPLVRDTAVVDGWVADAVRVHPDVRKAQAKIAVESAERLLNWQNVLPDIDVGLYSIAGDAFSPLVQTERWDNNYKLKATGETSLLFRKEIGKAQASSLKLASARLELDLQRRRVGIDIRSAVSTLLMVDDAIELQRANVASASQLRDAEEVRFQNGESTLLNVNLRERLLLDELVKLEQFIAKRMSAALAVNVARGVPLM